MFFNLFVCVCVSWLKRVEKRKENSSINQFSNEEPIERWGCWTAPWGKKNEAIHTLQSNCSLLSSSATSSSRTTQEWNQKFFPFYFFLSSKCWNSFSHQKPSIKPFSVFFFFFWSFALKPNIRSFLFDYFFVVVVWTDWIYRKRLGPSFFARLIFQCNRLYIHIYIFFF